MPGRLRSVVGRIVVVAGLITAGVTVGSVEQGGLDAWVTPVEAGGAAQTAGVVVVDTRTELVGPPAPTSAGEPATFVATVTGGGVPATGVVTFTAGRSSSAVAVVDGAATWTTIDLPVGTSDVTATFGGFGGFSSSVSPTIVHEVEVAPLAISGLRTVAVAGRNVEVTVSGFHPGESILFELHPGPVTVGHTVADGFGGASMTFPVPTAALGHRHLVVSGSRSGTTTSARTYVVKTLDPGGRPELHPPAPTDPGGERPDPEVAEPPSVEEPRQPGADGEQPQGADPVDRNKPSDPSEPEAAEGGTPPTGAGTPQVADRTARAARSELARTGVDPETMLRVGLGAVLAGCVVLALTRRRGRVA